MPEPLPDQIIQKIEQAAELYHRLVMLVTPAGAGKTATLQDVHERTAAPLINVNLELSRRMLDLTERQRALQLPRLLAQIVGASSADGVLLDNVEVLFDVSLKQDPLRLLQGLSRNKTVLAAWSGSIDGEHMVYKTIFREMAKNTWVSLRSVSAPQIASCLLPSCQQRYERSG